MQELAGKSILVVEDDAAIALDLRVALGKAGATVVGPAGSVAEAFAALAENRIDAAVLDVRLRRDELVFPVADSLAALRVPFIFASGRSAALVPYGLRDRAFVDKPFQSAEVCRKLAELLDTHVPASKEG